MQLSAFILFVSKIKLLHRNAVHAAAENRDDWMSMQAATTAPETELLRAPLIRHIELGECLLYSNTVSTPDASGTTDESIDALR